MRGDGIEREKGVPVDGALAFRMGFARTNNPYKTVHMRAKWREQFMLAEAERGPCLFPSCSGQCGRNEPCGPTSGAVQPVGV